METLGIFDFLSGQAVTVALATLRIVVAFMLVPIFANELIPATVRNAIFISLALIVITIQGEVHLEGLNTQAWVALFAKEIFIGIAIGVFFGIHLWAFETAGQIIDTQIGAAMAQIFDPIAGHQTTLIGEFLGRLANYVFMTAGGLMLLTGAAIESYALWPLERPLPDIAQASVVLFESEFAYFFKLTMLVAAPMMVVTFLLDISMGLINRYAPQFNVFFLSLSLKMLAVIFILIMSIYTLVQMLIAEILEHAGQLSELLKGLLG